MSAKEKELSEKELKQIEYEQICEDWRHRDSMLWQSLAVAITSTGVIFSGAFSKDMSWMLRSFLFGIAFIFNWILLLKISKDHYYQLGSSELLSILEGDKLISKFKTTTDKSVHTLRIYGPSDRFLRKMKEDKKLPFPTLYERLRKRPAFKWFFRVQLLLILIAFVSLCISVYYFLTSNC